MLRNPITSPAGEADASSPASSKPFTAIVRIVAAVAMPIATLLPLHAKAENYRIYAPGEIYNEVDRAIDLDGMLKKGERIMYRTRYMDKFRGIEVREVIVADCSLRKRGQLLRGDDPDTLPLYSTFPGTKYGKELDIACGEAFAGRADYAFWLRPQAPGAGQRPGDRPSSRTPKYGSGFVVGTNYVVTNYHVAGECNLLYVHHENEKVEAVMARSSKALDLAVVRISGLSGMAEPGIRSKAMLGEDVIAAGHPLSNLLAKDLVVTFGQVNALAGLENDQASFQISAQVHSGNSGGPLLDRSGNIVSVVAYKLNSAKAEPYIGDFAQNINFAIKPEVLREFLESAKVYYRKAEPEGKMDGVAIAERARRYTVKVECV
ncbi:S1C family serine protease [Noviherbaspirillum galbum]|uniref:Trypsin-like peptidase domain-containing protein n=1 Tax=Noviherbaspirillum galbum TaxID=2709383 RepID=A0A6B3SS38_9BURK|nr:serine protease [Noviherbaspirillum galbum]NEX61262.1 trypsin-like peptidase domain-containing protein [Noviherbaspirillum galbum]